MKKATPENHFHYNMELKSMASELRKRLTKSEACLWKYVLSRRQMKGYQFRRQRLVLNYIVDFLCKDLYLIVEVDGLIYDSEIAYAKDNKRDKDLMEVGFTVLRFSSCKVLNRIDDVSIMIGEWIDKNAKKPPPGPRQRGTTKSK